MQPRTLNIDNEFTPPAMRMWEWYDAWALYEELEQMEFRGLFEADESDDEDEHEFWAKHSADVASTHHPTMSREQRQARREVLRQFAAKRGIDPKEALRIRAGGHDIKSAHHMKKMFDKLMRDESPKERERRKEDAKQAAEKLKGEPAKVRAKDARARGQGVTERGGKFVGIGKKTADDKGLSRREAVRSAYAAAMTGPGDQTTDNPMRERAIHKHLDTHAKEGSTPNFAAIAARTNTSESDVKRIHRARAAGTHTDTGREFARQIQARIEKGDRMSHDEAGKMLHRLLRGRQEKSARRESTRKVKQAVDKGGREIDSGEGGTTTALKGAGDTGDTGKDFEDRAGRLKRYQAGQKRHDRLHHPDSGTKERKGPGFHDTMDTDKARERHEKLAQELDQDPKSSIHMGQAMSKLASKGHSAGQIADKLGVHHTRVERHLAGYSPETVGSSGGPQKKAHAYGAPARAAERGEEEARKSRAVKDVRKLMARGTRRLFPSSKSGQEEMPPHQPQIPSKPRPSKTISKDSPEFKQKLADFEKKRKEVVSAAGRHGTATQLPMGFKPGGRLPKDPEERQKVMAKGHKGVRQALSTLARRIGDKDDPENVAHKARKSKEKEALAVGKKSKKGKSQMHDDPVAHQVDVAGDPESKRSLGAKLGVEPKSQSAAHKKKSKEEFASAIGNIKSRIEKHGGEFMRAKLALQGGVPERRQSGHRVKGGQVEQDPERRQLPKVPKVSDQEKEHRSLADRFHKTQAAHQAAQRSGKESNIRSAKRARDKAFLAAKKAGVDPRKFSPTRPAPVDAPKGGIDEPTSSAKRRSKKIDAEGPQGREMSSLGKRVIGKREAGPEAAKFAARAEKKPEGDQRGASERWDTRKERGPAGAAARRAQRVGAGVKMSGQMADAERERKKKARADAAGLADMPADKKAPARTDVTVGWKGQPPTQPTAKERKKGARSQVRGEPIKVGRPVDPQARAAAQAAIRAQPPKSKPGMRAAYGAEAIKKAGLTPAEPKKPAPKPEPGAGQPGMVRMRPTKKGTGSTIRTFPSSSTTVAPSSEKKPGVHVQRAEGGRSAPRVDVHSSPSGSVEKAASQLFDRPRKPVTPPKPKPAEPKPLGREPLGDKMRREMAARKPKPQPQSAPPSLYGGGRAGAFPSPVKKKKKKRPEQEGGDIQRAEESLFARSPLVLA